MEIGHIESDIEFSCLNKLIQAIADMLENTILRDLSFLFAGYAINGFTLRVKPGS